MRLTDQHVECPAANVVRLCRSVMERGEIRQALEIGGDHLRINDGRLCRQMREGMCDDRETRREVHPVAGLDDDVLAFLVQLDAVAVEFDLVQPAVAFGWAITKRRLGA